MPDILKLLRLVTDKSIEEVANALNTIPRNINELESGQRNLTLKDLHNLAICFQIPADYILALVELKNNYNMSNQKLLFIILSYYISEDNILNIKNQYIKNIKRY